MVEAQSPEEDLKVTDLAFLDSKAFRDPRLWDLGSRWIVLNRLRARLVALALSQGMEERKVDAYHAHRIALGVPEGGKDYALGDTFPHEADFDQLNGVSFSKGCYVGQEVVSRMQNRATVRKRVVAIDGEAPLVPGAEVRAGEAVVGSVGSVAGRQALALVRLDRAAEAKAKRQTLAVNGVAVTLRKPEWARFALAPTESAEAP
jgi:folate-binding protein YgfZ